jgi:hypothetical protein
MRKAFLAALVALLVCAALALPGVAKADSPVYQPSQCNWNGYALICERTFQTTESNTIFYYVADATCLSGQRYFSFTGTVLVTWRQFDVFIGHAQLEKWHGAGDESPIAYEPLVGETTDLGCA